MRPELLPTLQFLGRGVWHDFMSVVAQATVGVSADAGGGASEGVRHLEWSFHSWLSSVGRFDYACRDRHGRIRPAAETHTDA
jgi:hypothetical protein